ncbi:CRAL-TRIO domain [Pseudocohnilembus persalinus]|uniref:CRAL-TRIO domain n=1 Tax=Pseudocohnilembus persalinus TaxID=266149 RepID=A0A0V0R5J7_PSEPJ|nr:CRAL-TRIO domain [Pseudocohnilembus persalinus]|eukprot:KRX09616.1 CRAL-TRIO domain [Pseudocohnilembus persalinus]
MLKYILFLKSQIKQTSGEKENQLTEYKIQNKFNGVLMDITPGSEKSSQENLIQKQSNQQVTSQDEQLYQYVLVSKKKIQQGQCVTFVSQLINDEIVQFGETNDNEKKIGNEDNQGQEQKQEHFEIDNTVAEIEKQLNDQHFKAFKELREQVDKLSKEICENQTNLNNNQILSTLQCFDFQKDQAFDLSQENLKNKINDKKEFLQIQEDYSQDQIAIIKKFKSLVEKKNLPRYFDTQYLIRFLKGRNWEIDDAIEMFEIFLKWREQHLVEKINEHNFDQEINQLREIFPHAYHSTDIQGRPVYIEILSDLKYDDMIKPDEDSEKGIMTKQRIEKYFIKEFEQLVNVIFPKCSKVQGKNINQMVRIIDMKNYKLKPDQIKSFLNLTQGILQDNYPEILGQMYLINVNATFKFMWKGVKLILPKSTQKKIEVLGKDYKNELLKIIKEEDLPVQLGGTCDNCDGKCLNKHIGNWENSQ